MDTGELMKTPEKILFFWRGGPIPAWRQECSDQLIRIYPDAEQLYNYDFTRPFHEEDREEWRLGMCAKHKYCLYPDNDVWLDSPLNLSEKPSVAFEYGGGHTSFVWSGGHPELLVGETITSIFTMWPHRGDVECLLITGKHWGSDVGGNKCDRWN